MDQLRTHILSAFIGRGNGRTFPRTFAINKRQPIRGYMVTAQFVNSGNIRQWRDPVMLSWREGLGANLVLVVDIQKARDDRGDAMRRCGLRLILFTSKRDG
jgi:hypothetical protein